jgi:hypothetical protein
MAAIERVAVMQHLPRVTQTWVMGMVGGVAIGALAYFGSHSCPQNVREAASAVLATISGSLWILSALVPSPSAIGRCLSVFAAALAALSGILLLP